MYKLNQITIPACPTLTLQHLTVQRWQPPLDAQIWSYLCKTHPKLPSFLRAARFWDEVLSWSRHRCKQTANQTPESHPRSTLLQKEKKALGANPAWDKSCHWRTQCDITPRWCPQLQCQLWQEGAKVLGLTRLPYCPLKSWRHALTKISLPSSLSFQELQVLRRVCLLMWNQPAMNGQCGQHVETSISKNPWCLSWEIEMCSYYKSFMW